MYKIALINQKGGVGKTTSTINIGAGLKQLGYKVLLIDMDPQANLSYSLGIQAHELEYTIYDVLKGESDFSDAVQTIEGVDVLPSTLDLAGFDLEYSSKMGRENKLKRALKDMNGYDFILIDCPPSLGLLTLNALVYVNEVFIVLQPEFLALKGMAKLYETVEDVISEGLNDSLRVSGLICSLYDSRKNLHREIIEKIKENYQEIVFDTVIRTNVSLPESQTQGQSIFTYKPTSSGAEDYLQLATEIKERFTNG